MFSLKKKAKLNMFVLRHITEAFFRILIKKIYAIEWQIKKTPNIYDKIINDDKNHDEVN